MIARTIGTISPAGTASAGCAGWAANRGRKGSPQDDLVAVPLPSRAAYGMYDALHKHTIGYLAALILPTDALSWDVDNRAI
jgi:hypothetical protein